jgi:hypothetical protein
MKKLFLNFWVTLGLMALVTIADLIGLTSGTEIGLGFIITLIYFAIGAYLETKKKS